MKHALDKLYVHTGFESKCKPTSLVTVSLYRSLFLHLPFCVKTFATKRASSGGTATLGVLEQIQT